MIVSITVILTLISFFIWYKYGRDNLTVPVVTFKPPAGLNPAEAELAYKGKITYAGILGLVFYLANKGYLKIQNDFVRTIFWFEKIKDYDGTNFMEKDFLDMLFVHGKSFEPYSDAHIAYLMKYYYEFIKKHNEKKKVLFEKDSLNPTLKGITIFNFVTVLLFTLSYLFYKDNAILSIMVLAYLVQCFPILFIFSKFKLGRIGLILLFIFQGFMFAMMALFAMMLIGKDFPAFLTCLAGTVICGICMYHLPKRNRIGQNILGRLEGLKKFLETTEKHKLKQLVKQNTLQFYDVLPYIFVLGAFGHVADLLGSVMMSPPNWYVGEEFSMEQIKKAMGLLKFVV